MEYEIEQKLAQLLLLSRLIDVPVESSADWQARRDCEVFFFRIDAELQAAHICYGYSKRAGRFLHERYRLVVDNFLDDGLRRVACWTLIDTLLDGGRGAPVWAVLDEADEPRDDPDLSDPASPPLPVFYSMPMKTREDRARANALCERWNLAHARLCPSCCQPLAGGDIPEGPYLNRGQLCCASCHEAAMQ